MSTWREVRRGRLILVCYDVVDARRLRRVARICEGYGNRAQHSVFECFLDERQLREMKGKIESVVKEEDRVAYIQLCGKCRAGMYAHGQGKKPIDWDYFVV